MTRQFEQYTFYVPVRTTTTASTWGGWQIVSPRCYGCLHAAVKFGKLVCYCASRTMSHDAHGDTCESYFGRDAR